MLLMEGLKSRLYHPLLLGDILVLYSVHIDFIMDASLLDGLKKACFTNDCYLEIFLSYIVCILTLLWMPLFLMD